MLVLLHVPVDHLGAVQQLVDVLVHHIDVLQQLAPMRQHVLEELMARTGGPAILVASLFLCVDQRFMNLVEDIGDHRIAL